jgi:pyruvate formate lyase activating enzyme
VRATELRIGGFVPLSSCDWPGELVATVFCQGCPWDCAYCHNAHLRDADGSGDVAGRADVPGDRSVALPGVASLGATDDVTGDPEGALSWQSLLGFLRSRMGLLDGLVFSGGEPTLQRELSAAMRQVRALGFRIGLHTAGPYPDRLADLLPLVDWVGFDVKAPFDDYAQVTGVPNSGDRARASLRHVLASGVSCEVRTTVHPDLLDAPALHRLADSLAGMGVRHYALQAFQSTGCRNNALRTARPAAAPRLPDHVTARFASVVVREGVASHAYGAAR